jgi:hypothetical protein
MFASIRRHRIYLHRNFPLYNLFDLCSTPQMENESLQNLPAAFTSSRQASGWTIDRQRAFLEMLAQCGIVERAAGLVGMTRQSAYHFRQSTAGRAFHLAWDAALLVARQRMIDETYELAFEGSVEQIYRDGKLVQEKRKRDPKMLLATVERLGGKAVLGSAPAKAVAQEFSTFLNAMDADAYGGECGVAHFMECRAEWDSSVNKRQLKDSSFLLSRAALDVREEALRLEDRRAT